MVTRHTVDIEEAKKEFFRYIQTQGLRNTLQRQQIMDVFFENDDLHLSTEELYDRVRLLDPSIGQATIYRTMKLLCEAGIAREVRFDDGLARYEWAHGAHHDHLVCEKCGLKVEVVDPEIERLQEDLAKKHGFLPTSHTLYLYGLCPSCRNEKPSSPK